MMKKWLIGLLMTCLLMCACTALADEVSLTLIDDKVDKQMEWLSGTDYTIEGEYGKRALVAADGRKLTQSVYNFFSDVYVDIGLINGTDSDGDWGVLSMEGDILVPFDYEATDIFNKYWVMCTPHASSAKLEFWNMQAGELAFTLPRDQYEKGFSPTGSQILLIQDKQGKVTVYNIEGEKIDTTDSLYGYDGAESIEPYEMLKLSDGTTMVDESGSMLIAPGDYTSLQTEDGWYFRAMQNGKTGVIDANGNEIVPFDKDNDLYYSSWSPAKHPGYVGGGYASAVRDDRLYFYDVHGSLTASYNYSYNEEGFRMLHASAYTAKSEGSAHILAADGTESTIQYDKYIFVPNNSSGYFFETVNSDYDRALYDWHGQQVLPYQYSNFQFSTDGRYLLAKSDDSKYAELYEVTYPDVWYVMYDESRFAGSYGGSEEEEKNEPSPASLAVVLEQGVLKGEIAKSKAPARSGNILTNNRPTAFTAAPTAEPTLAPAMQPASPSHAEADALLSSALVLLDSSAETSGQAIAQLISTAAIKLEDTPAAGILQSAVILASTDAAGNAAGIRQLIETAQTMY